MTYDIISTGSSGNAVVINGEILIDCGVSMKKLRESGYIKGLKLVLLTHEHGDHFNTATVRALHKERPSLRWCCCNWMVPNLLSAGVDKRVIDIAYFTSPGQTSQALIYNNIAIVLPEPLAHDVPNCGWRICSKKEWLFYATDTGTLDHLEVKNYNYYLIEANHTRAEIEARIMDKQSRGEFAYETRAAANHLSQEQAMDWLARNVGPNSRYVFLHQHVERVERMAEYIERMAAISALLDCPTMGHTGVILASDALKRLNDAPAVKGVSPVVHGRWVHASSLADPFCEVWRCSQCSAEDENGSCYNFCPNCGALMDKEDTDGT